MFRKNKFKYVIIIISSFLLLYFPQTISAKWRFCATEGGYCSFDGCTANVMYGTSATDSWTYKRHSNGVKCSNSHFPKDPSVGYVKYCYYAWWECKTLSLTLPAGGEKWIAGTQQLIKWTSKEISTIKIQYTTDNINWKTVASSVSSSSGSYNWTIPNETSENCKVRIIDNDDDDISSTSKTFSMVYPIAQISNPPETLIKTTELFLEIAGENVTHYKYKLNEQEFSDEFEVTEDIHLTDLNSGTYTLCVLGRDEFENWQTDSNPTMITWTVDAPEAIITNPPDRITNQKELILMIGGEGLTHYKYKLNENDYSEEIEIENSAHLSNLNDGINTFYLLGSYNLAVWQSADNPTMITWIVDTQPPQINNFVVSDLNSNNIVLTNNRNVKTTMHATDNNGIISRWLITETFDIPTINQMSEGSSYPISEYTIQSIDDGLKMLYVWAKDEAGNINSIYKQTIFLDTIAQFTLQPINQCISENSLVLSGTREERTTIQTIYNNNTIESTYPDETTWTTVISDLVDGNYDLTITAVDRLQNKNIKSMNIRTSIPVSANIETSDNKLLADSGLSELDVMITIKDSLDLPVCDETSIHVTTSLGEFQSEYKVLNGQLKGILKSSFTLGNTNISALFDSKIIGSTQIEMIPGNIEKLVFDPDELNITINTDSKYIRLESQDAYGHSIIIAQDKSVLLRSTSMNNAIFKLFTDTVEEKGDREVILQSGKSYVMFKYKDTQLGEHEITAIDISNELKTAAMNISVTKKTPSYAVLSANPSQIFANGESESTLTITLYYEDHSTLVDDGTIVLVSSDLGCQIQGSGTTKDGVMQRTIVAGAQIGSPIISLTDGEGRPIQYSWESESIPLNISMPEVTLTGVPDEFTNSGNIRISVGGAGILSYQYKLNDESWSEVLDVNFPIDLKYLKEGSYTLQVDGKVINDNNSQPVGDTSETWIVDLTKPIIHISSPQMDDRLQPVYIEGIASDHYSGLMNIDLQITDGTYYMDSSGKLVNNPNWLTISYIENTDLWQFNVSGFSSFKENHIYTITARALDKAENVSTHSISFVYGLPKDNSDITCNLSKNIFILGQSITINGKINPAPKEVGKGITLDFQSPFGEIKQDFTLADMNGEFNYDLKCSFIDCAGKWSVKTSWSGDDIHNGAESQFFKFVVSKAGSKLDIDVFPQSIKIGEKIRIVGTLESEPHCTNMKASPIHLYMLNGSDQVYFDNIVTNESGQFIIDNYMLSSLGKWSIYAEYEGIDSYAMSKSEIINVNVVKSAGYAIIIQGRDSCNEGLDEHRKTTDFVYKRLQERGLQEKDITYLYNTSNANISKADVQYAITSWAKNNMNDIPGNLYIIMINHGNKERFLMGSPMENIKSGDLSEWLNSLQNGLKNNLSSELDIVVILGFCHSGSFLDDLSGDNRVIIASAAADEASTRGPASGDEIREGEYFVSEFFKSVVYGKSLNNCFAAAVQKTEEYRDRLSNMPRNKRGPYFDNSEQHPLLDDNHDGFGSNNLDAEADGLKSKNLYIGVSMNMDNAPGDAIITEVSDTKFIDALSEFNEILWATVNDRDRVSSIWIEIKPPYYQSDTDESNQDLLELKKWISLSYNEIEERYEWKKDSLGSDFVDEFSTPGMYNVFYYAIDKETQNISPMMMSRVYKRKIDNAAPYNFYIVSPQNEEEAKTKVILEWTAVSKDPEGDQFTYTLHLSRDDDNFDNKTTIIHENLTENMYLAELPSSGVETWDNKTIYWKVQAIDEYGAIRETQVHFFKTNNTNEWPGWIEGYIFDTYSGIPLSNATLTLKKDNITKQIIALPSGYFLGTVESGVYDIEIQQDDYYNTKISSVEILEGSIWKRYIAMEPIPVIGDLNGTGKVTIEDIMLALKVLSGMEILEPLYLNNILENRVNIGLAEIIYIMRKVAQ
jgi:hypothetical protein